MTRGRYTGQTKAGIGNHNLQYQKDICVCLFWCWKKGHSEPLRTVFQDNYFRQNPSRERSTDRCKLLSVYHFRNIANVVRMDQSENLFLHSLWCWCEIYESSLRMSVNSPLNMHSPSIISAEQRSSYKGQWHQCSNLPRGMLVVSHTGKHTAMETAWVWPCIRVKRIPRGAHTHKQREITAKQSDRGSPLKTMLTHDQTVPEQLCKAACVHIFLFKKALQRSTED